MARKQRCESASCKLNMLHSGRLDLETGLDPCFCNEGCRCSLLELSMAPVKTQGLELAVALSLFHIRGSIVLLSLSYVMMLTVGKFLDFSADDLDLDWGRKLASYRMQKGNCIER